MRRAIRTRSVRRVAGMIAAVVPIVAIAAASGCSQERSGSFKLNPSKASSAGIGF
jgi:hypothetical protein